MAQKSVSTSRSSSWYARAVSGSKAQLEVLLPVQRGAGLGQFVVAVARAGDAQRHVGGVRRDLVGDAALLHVVLLGQAQVFLGRDVAEHARAVVGRRRRADGNW
jgi:hypothetical protein